MNNNTVVKCNVASCKHNKLHNCGLNTLNISCTCDSYDCEQKKDTICSNFARK